MKRYGNLYQQIYDLDNLRLAHQNAKRGKGWYSEVQAVDADLETYLKRLQDMLINHTYKTSEYTSFIKKEGKKEREIFKLPQGCQIRESPSEITFPSIAATTFFPISTDG